MAVRAVVAATLLLSVFSINLILSKSEFLYPFYILAAVTFLLVLIYALLYSCRDRFWYSASQVAGDILTITVFVYVSGGLRSPMSFLYLLPVITAALLLPRWGPFVAAGLAWAFYAALALGTVGHLLPDYPPGITADLDLSAETLWYSLVTHLLGFLSAAYLVGYLAERLRSAGHELAQRRSDLAELRALNENIVESITSGLITTDLDGRINFVNPAGCEITRMSAQEVTGRNVADLLGLEPGVLQRIRGVLGEERRYRFERSCRLGEGSERFLGVTASVLRERGDKGAQALGLIFIFQDLTEISALEREVRLKERMAALGEMAAGMAHELRNPLASIVGSVQVLRDGAGLDGEQPDLMEIILRESERLDQAIRDFLLFARPGPFTPERTDLVRLINDSIRLLRNAPDFHSGHKVETRFEAQEILCEVDVNRAKQVFWNLASNALKAMPTGGRLMIRVEPADPGSVRIVFADEGVGMNEQQLETYFQPFHGGFRDGTGLGAAIVYRIVQEHGGTVTVRSAAGQGTEVVLILPVEASAVVQAAGQAVPAGDHALAR